MNAKTKDELSVRDMALAMFMAGESQRALEAAARLDFEPFDPRGAWDQLVAAAYILNRNGSGDMAANALFDRCLYKHATERTNKFLRDMKRRGVAEADIHAALKRKLAERGAA